MKSYWFIRCTIYYNDETDDTIEIKNNIVLSLETKSFLPGLVTRVIKNKLIEVVAEEINQENRLEVFIDFFHEIDEVGYVDFVEEGGSDSKCEYCIRGLKYYHGKIFSE